MNLGQLLIDHCANSKLIMKDHQFKLIKKSDNNITEIQEYTFNCEICGTELFIGFGVWYNGRLIKDAMYVLGCNETIIKSIIE